MTGGAGNRFLSLVSAAEVYACIAETAPVGLETVPWQEAIDRVLAEPVSANDDVPHFARSNMDGYAVRASDTQQASELSSVALKLTGEVPMGEPAAVQVGPGEAVRVSTGAMLPPGADAVVIVEHCRESGDRVHVGRAVIPGQNTISIGEELRTGDTVIEPGRRLRPADLGSLSVAGAGPIRVYRRPRAGVIVTGDEIVGPGIALGPGQVRNVNQFVLREAARKAHAEVHDYGVVGDDGDKLMHTLSRAVEECDSVFLSGGSSKGVKDLTRSSILSLAGAELLFHGVAIAPGKPTLLARAAACTLMGLPGNPAATAVVFHLFGAVLLRVLGGEPIETILRTRPRVKARLLESVASMDGRDQYVRVRLEGSRTGSVAEAAEALPSALVLRGKSAAITTVGRADGLVRVERAGPGLEAGSIVDVWLLT